MNISEIKHLAELGKLELSEDELTSFKNDFDAILKFVSQVEKADTDCGGSFRTVSISELREDEVRPSMPVSEILKNAPKHDGEFFYVPQVVE